MRSLIDPRQGFSETNFGAAGILATIFGDGLRKKELRVELCVARSAPPILVRGDGDRNFRWRICTARVSILVMALQIALPTRNGQANDMRRNSGSPTPCDAATDIGR